MTQKGTFEYFIFISQTQTKLFAIHQREFKNTPIVCETQLETSWYIDFHFTTLPIEVIGTLSYSEAYTNKKGLQT